MPRSSVGGLVRVVCWFLLRKSTTGFLHQMRQRRQGLPNVGSNFRTLSRTVEKSNIVFFCQRLRLFSTRENSALQDASDPGTSLPSTSRKRHVVNWETANGTVQFHAVDGETLRTASLRRGVVSPHNGRAQLINCRGLGTCGTCAVEVKSGIVHPKERNTKEQLRLSFPPHGGDHQPTSLRLACQIQVQSDLEVIKHSGFWGQCYDTLSTSKECQTFFGDLEFILDTRSPEETANVEGTGRK